MKYEIKRLDESTSCFLPHTHQPFDVIGRFIPLYDGEKWSYKEIRCSENRQKTYRDDPIDPMDYIENKEQAIFLAVSKDICVGSIRISTGWFGDGYIEDLAIDAQYRHLGIGKKLMESAVAWCKEQEYSGIALETQDINLQACRFYTKYGFELCGVNTRKYALLKECEDEIALYFYFRLSES